MRWASIVAACIMLVGCGSTQEVSAPSLPGGCDVIGPMAVVAGGRSNMPAPSVAALGRYLEPVARAGEEVSVVDSGADPGVLGGVDFTATAQNPVAAEREIGMAADRLRTGIEGVRATAPGADPLRALDLAARQIHGSSTEGTVVMADSGLQTEGVLDFTRRGMLRAEPKDLVSGLAEAGQLPDLSGIRVFLVGIGDTSAPQEPLDTASRRQLAEQWVAIVEAAGASCVGVDERPVTGPPPVGAPAVAVVRVPEVTALMPAESVVLDGESVAFVSDSAQLRDAEFAKAQLADVARYLQESGESVLLTGTTATDGTPSGRRALSLQRAQTVKAVLVELGVPAEHIRTRGVGTDHPEHIQDLDAQGRLIPAKAARNRTVLGGPNMSVVEMILFTPFFVGALILAVSGWEALMDAKEEALAERRYRKVALRRAKEARDDVAR